MPNIEPTWTQHTPNMTPTKAQRWIFSLDKLPCSSQVSFRRLLRSHSGKFTFMQVGFRFFSSGSGASSGRFWCSVQVKLPKLQCGSGTFQCSAQVRFRQVPMRFQCGFQVKFRKVPVVPEGSAAFPQSNTGRFRFSACTQWLIF